MLFLLGFFFRKPFLLGAARGVTRVAFLCGASGDDEAPRCTTVGFIFRRFAFLGVSSGDDEALRGLALLAVTSVSLRPAG